MDAYQRRRGVNVTHHQRDCAFGSVAVAFRAVFAVGRDSRSIGVAFKAMDAKLSPARGEVCLSYFSQGQAGHTSIISRSNDWQCSPVTVEPLQDHRKRAA